MLPGEHTVTAEIAERYERPLREMNALHNLVVEMLSPAHGEWKVPRRGLNPFVVVTVAGLTVKAAKTFRAIQVLLEHGLVDDAKALIRVLFETTITVLFILQRNSRQRTRQYHAHDAINMLKMLEHWKRTPGLKRGASKDALAAAQTLVALSSKKVPAGVNVRKHWSGLGSLTDAAKAVGHERMYATLYRYTSTAAHATDFGAHVDALTKPGELVFNLPPSSEGVAAAASIASEVFWLLATRIDKRFALGYEIRLAVHKVTEIPA